MTRRVAVITGGGSGIGRAVAISLAKRDYRLVLAGRRGQALLDTAALLPITDALCVETDVRDEASVDALFAAAVEHCGRVDLLFNNAGTNVPAAPIENLTLADWRAVFDVNVIGAFLCLRAAFRVMKQQSPKGGRIINNGSISAHAPRPRSAPYTASKHAITGLTKSASLDGRAYDIACGQIDVGNAATEMAAAMPAGVLQADGECRAEPVMNVDTVGEAVAYMDSLPLDANVQWLTVAATKMPFVGRG